MILLSTFFAFRSLEFNVSNLFITGLSFFLRFFNNWLFFLLSIFIIFWWPLLLLIFFHLCSFFFGFLSFFLSFNLFFFLYLLELFRIFFHLSSQRFDMLITFLILSLDKAEYFSYHSKTIDGCYIISFTLKEWCCSGSDGLEFFGGILVIVDSSSVRQSIMHCQFLFKIPDFFLISFDCYCWINHWIDNSLIFNFHHSGREL